LVLRLRGGMRNWNEEKLENGPQPKLRSWMALPTLDGSADLISLNFICCWSLFCSLNF
jgi:hypothetical protein